MCVPQPGSGQVCCPQSPVWAGACGHPCFENLLTWPVWHLFQCPRVNGIKAHINKRNRRQVTLDLQIW